MNKNEFSKFGDFIKFDEAKAWENVQQLRQRYESSHETLFDKMDISSIEQAKEKSFEVVSRTLKVLEGVIDLENLDPGHGFGHLVRDYLHSVTLAENLKMDPKQAYIGIIGGALHDILGCTLIDRYSEKDRVVRHAEAGALLFGELAKEIDIDQDDALLVAYAISAHTNYLKSLKIKCSDGEEREISPYKEIDSQGNPILSVLLTRWADRFDVNGPCFVGRHYLTMAEEHDDFASGDFYRIKYSEHMRPLLRSEEDIKSDPKGRTMREHLMMYLQSQSNDSPYGKFDYGYVVVMRDEYKESLLRIMSSFKNALKLTPEEENHLLLKWDNWLFKNVEPSLTAKQAAEKLHEMFSNLPQETKEIWFNVFKTTLSEYESWSKKMISKFPENKYYLPILGDIRNII